MNRSEDILARFAAHGQRLAQEREAAAAAAAAAAEASAQAAVEALLPAQVPVTPMLDSPARFELHGFHFVLPQAAAFRSMQLALDYQGETVELRTQRRKVAEAQTLEQLFADELDALGHRHPQLRIVRQREALLAGSKALALDYQFFEGGDLRQGRLVAGLVPQTNSHAPQWFSIGCVIDPNLHALSDWLLQFDQMLEGLAGA